MIIYYVKIALRSIINNRMFSLINIIGLAAGISSFILILIYVRHERGYDMFHENGDMIYRLRYERSSAEGESVRFASCCPPAAIRIRQLYPEVETIARLFRYRATVIFGDIKFYEERMFFAEPQVFDVFSFSFLAGAAADGIKNANTAFISESCSKKYFGDEDPMGKTITIDREMSFVITGIFRDMPGNSHIRADILLSWPNLLTHYGADIETSWGDTGFFTYFILKAGADPGEFEEKLKSLVEMDFGDELRRYRLTCDLKVQPLSQIHLNSHFMQELEVNGNSNTVLFLNIIAFFILAIAWVNYINITTARSLTRAMEVGLSKISGAGRGQLILQFVTETLLLNLAAFFVSFILILILYPLFCNLTGILPAASPFTQSWFIITFILLFFASVILSGIYPAFILTSFSTSEVFKGRYIHTGTGLLTRRALVVFQLLMAISLVTCTYFVFRQVRFLQGRDKGISTSDVLIVRAPRVRDESFGSRLTAFREELLKNQAINRFSMGTEVPGRQILWDAGGIFRVGSDQSKNYQIIGIDYDYLDLLEAEIIAGRNFSREFADSSSLLLNEKAVQWMGFSSPEEAVGKLVDYWGRIYKIAGIVKDYCQQSPREAFEPHIFRFMPHGRDVRGFFMMKYNPGNEGVVLDLAEKEFSSFFPDNPFDYFFLEDYYEQQYRDEWLLGTVFGAFALLSIIITCLGIFGLTSFMVLRKTREIAIRRVAGAGFPGIFFLFSRDFVFMTLTAFCIAFPACYLWLSLWLRNFEMRMDLNLLSFVIPLIIVPVLSLLTIFLVVAGTASANPAHNLRNE